MVNSNTSPSNLCGFIREYSIAVGRVPRDVMHAHVLASPSSAEELRKHLTELNAYRDGEAEVKILAYDVVGRDWLPCGS